MTKDKQERRYRPKVSDTAVLQAALMHGQILCGCGCGMIIRPDEMEKEHDPALELRMYDPKSRTYMPDANDPKYLRLWIRDHHKRKTHGPGGIQRITTKGSDNHTRRHGEAMSVRHRAHIEKMRRKTFGNASQGIEDADT
jgi:hypothetical protein